MTDFLTRVLTQATISHLKDIGYSLISNWVKSDSPCNNPECHFAEYVKLGKPIYFSTLSNLQPDAPEVAKTLQQKLASDPSTKAHNGLMICSSILQYSYRENRYIDGGYTSKSSGVSYGAECVGVSWADSLKFYHISAYVFQTDIVDEDMVYVRFGIDWPMFRIGRVDLETIYSQVRKAFVPPVIYEYE